MERQKMRYVIPDDYDSFRCLADRCPDTCCRGWQISIDEISLKKYANMRGLIGNRLRNSIDWRSRAFLQYGAGCALLGEEGLCDLQLEAGEAALCDTCRLYPRHEEEFDHVRELSLSLSCPEAAGMAVSREAPLYFNERETEEEDDFDEFDGVLFEHLLELRRTMISIAQDRKLPLPERLRQISFLGHAAQAILEGGEEGEPLLTSETAQEAADPKNGLLILRELSGLKDRFSVLQDLYILDERLEDLLDHTREQLCTQGEELNRLTLEWMEKHETAGEQILVQLLYVYLCGAVYDRQISSKSSLAVNSVVWIFLISAANSLTDTELNEKGLLTEVTWRLARTIEHDDENLSRLEAGLILQAGLI